MWRRRQTAVLMLLSLSSLAFSAAASAQDGTLQGRDIMSVTRPDGLVTVYATGNAPPGIQLAIRERSLRRSLGIAAEDFQDPFEDPSIDLVVAGTTDRLGDLIGIGGGVFLSQEPASPAAMSVDDRRALRGSADISRAFGGRTIGLALIVEPPDIAMIEAQALYPDRSYAAVIGCELEGETLALTEVTFDRLARRVSLFAEGPLAALRDGAGSRVYIAHRVACGP